MLGGLYMYSNENSTGRPLADAKWLEDHHIAKIPERMAFAKKLSISQPKSLVDLGCATGLWLDLLDKVLPEYCEFIGIDSDYESLKIAKSKSKKWSRKASFIKMDIEQDAQKIPACDLTLAFNIFPYIKNLDIFIETLSSRSPKGTLAVRQYDGASIRFGPMPTHQRQEIETSLRVAMESSQKFHHYDMDRVYSALKNSYYKEIELGFELFARNSPFPDEFIPYYTGTLNWTMQHISDNVASYLNRWMKEDASLLNRYFFEVDLIALLS